MKVIKWIVSRVLIPLLLALGIAYGVLYFISSKTGFNNPVTSILFAKPYQVSLAGTGSMYKTLYWDKKEGGPEDYSTALSQNSERVVPHLFPHVFLTYNNFTFEQPKIGFGDIVSFQGPDPETHEQVSFIKRVIGLPGDTIELRDGHVLRNEQVLLEPYTLKPRSTFGGSTVLECREVTIPQDHYFVLGDNRKLSFDSRFDLGFVEVGNIDSILPFGKQTNLRSFFRTASEENLLSTKEVLNIGEFVSLINGLRAELNLEPLQISSLLKSSATNRANSILTYNNFEIKGANGNSYFPGEMAKVGYNNPLTAEFLVQGYFDAEELFALRLESASFKNLLLEKAYQDIGVGVLNKEVDDCPTQVVVIHFGGYVPADYSSNTLNSWREAVKDLTKLSNNWEQAEGNDLYDQDKLEEVLSDIEEAINIANNILEKMEGKLWLSASDERDSARYEDLIDEINTGLEELDQEAEKKLDD